MRIMTHSAPCLLLEAAELVYGLVNRLSPQELTADGKYCIPPEDMRRISQTACAGLSADDPRLQFYFSGVPIEGAPHRTFCLGRCLLYASLNVDCSDVDSAVAAMSAAWGRGDEPLHITGVYGYSIGIGAPQSSFSSLAQEVAQLPLPQSCQMQLVEVLANTDKHLRIVSEILRPVASSLEALLQPWIRQAAPLLAQWENFFRQEDANDFLLQRCQFDQSQIDSLNLALRYISPNLTMGSFQAPSSALHLHMGLNATVSKLREPKSPALDERDFAALRLLANPARAEMLRLLVGRTMSAQSVATTLGMHVGSVFRDLNNLYNAQLLLVSSVNGRNSYRTSPAMIRSVTQRLNQYIFSEAESGPEDPQTNGMT